MRYASQWNIPCLKTAWINDSIKEGYALNLDQYNTQIKATISTPKMDTSKFSFIIIFINLKLPLQRKIINI